MNTINEYSLFKVTIMGFFRFFKTKKAAEERAEIVKKQGGKPTIIIGTDHHNQICYVVGNDSKVNISSSSKK